MEKMPEQEKKVVEKLETISSPATANEIEKLEDGINSVSVNIESINTDKKNTIDKIKGIRRFFGLPTEGVAIPSVDAEEKRIIDLDKKKQELEKLLQENISSKYNDAIERVRNSKIDWAHSAELARRLRLKGASDEDVEKVKDWLISNANNVKIFVLPATKFRDVMDILSKLAEDADAANASGVYVGLRDEIPESARESIVVPEGLGLGNHFAKDKPESWKATSQGSENIDEVVLSHEFGHATADGLLETTLFKKWNPKFVQNAPDPEYVGRIRETDTRIRSMYRDIAESFDPSREKFGRKQLLILKEKFENGKLSQDTIDLFQHYDVLDVVRMANRLPAI